MDFRLTDASRKQIDQRTLKTGFRKIQLVMNEGSWDEPRILPKTRSVPPMQLEINGRMIFCKGTNWVNPEIFPGIISRDRYNELLDRAKEANFNLLRVWGGGIVNKDSFYELCDEKGILVWQEFPLACNNYEGTPRYLKILEQESESIIKRLRTHPSLAIWCGGNELFNNWSKMTDQSLAIRLLNSQCFLLDPKTPFLPTSPVMGMGHGHYVFRDPESKEEVFQLMARADNTAYTEFGMPSPASVEILKSIIPEDELWPPKPGTSWESHHAFKAWIGNTWLMADMLADYFGEAKNLAELVANGQLIQCEGYKAIYEEARRQKPYCSMALNWCFNEPWPTAANNSLISWPDIPKPGFYAVKNACRPFLASARIKKFKYAEREEFSAGIWVLNDLPVQVVGGKMRIKLITDQAEIKLLDWEFDRTKENTNLHGPTVRCKLPAWETDRFKLILEVEGHPEYNSEYTLLYTPATVEKKESGLQNQ
jgi:beta-mannosidase